MRLDDSFGGGDWRAMGDNRSRTFGDWQRYRSAFNEAIELPAMSEHLPGVTMTVHLAVSRGGERQAPSGHLRAGSRVSSCRSHHALRDRASEIMPRVDTRPRR